MSAWGFRRSRFRQDPIVRIGSSSRRVVAAWIVLAMVAAGCGEDTARMSVGSVGRATTSTVEPVVLAMVDGIPSCEEAEPLEADEDHQPYGEVRLDQATIATLNDYAATRPDSFAGMWLDARYGGLPLLAFSGEIDAHWQAAIDLLPDGTAGVSFAMAQAPASERGLRDMARAVEELAATDGVGPLRSTDLDLRTNRVVLDLLDPTESQLDTLLDQIEAAGLPADRFCSIVTVSPPIPEGPLQVLPESGRPRLVSCGDFSFPLTSLLERTPISESDHPAAAVVSQYVGGDQGASAGADGQWIVLGIEADRAYFGKYSDGLQATAEAVTGGGAWDVAGWAFGCELQVGLPAGLGVVEIFLDPARPPSADDRSVWVLVSELACADGREMGRRLLGPQVIESDERIQLAFAAVVTEGGVQECLGNPVTAVEVPLDRPIGGRTLLNGMYLPPKTLTYQ